MASEVFTVPILSSLSGALLLPLGAGLTEKAGVGNKGRLLDEAASVELPVPSGFILLDSVWVAAAAEGRIRIEDEAVVCDDKAVFYAALGLPEFPKKSKVVVRSAFTVEDSPSQSMAGHFASILDVDPTEPDAFVDALCAVWSSALAYDDIRRDVLVMAQVEAEYAGVAFTEADYEDDYVNFTEGLGDKLLSGEADGDNLELTRLRQFEKGDREEGMARAGANWQDRLQVLLRRVRGTFGETAWDIEWADDGTTCYLLQVRPITAPTRRNEAFTRANHKEILPDLPSVYMTDAIETCSADLYSWYRGFDKNLPQHRPFIEVFKGRPYINLSLMTETMRALGLPTNLVTDNIGGDEATSSGFRIKRALSKLPNLAQLGLSQLGAVRSAADTGKAIQERGMNPGDTFNAVNASFKWMYVTLVHEMFNLTQAMSLPLVQLRRSGKLAEMAAATRTISTQMYDDLVPLREYAKANPDLAAVIEGGDDMPDDPEFKRRFGLYLTKYGHRGIYESDIARPRYAQDPAPLLAALTADSVTPVRAAKDADDLGMIASQARKLIIAREQLRHDAMRGFANVRKQLLKLGEAAVEAGQIPSAEAVFDMTLAETALLDVGWQPEPDFFEQRSAEIDSLRGYDMPDTLYRFDDLDAFAHDFDATATRLKGMGLVDGTVTGTVWVLQEPETSLPDGFDPATTILVARSVDSGWVPTFTKVAGVVVETGGDLSHGSIILRELGLVSATNVKTATRVLQTGDTVTLNGGNGVVKKADA
jgi:rifampicin phosphotransferase